MKGTGYLSPAVVPVSAVVRTVVADLRCCCCCSAETAGAAVPAGSSSSPEKGKKITRVMMTLV